MVSKTLVKSKNSQETSKDGFSFSGEIIMFVLLFLLGIIIALQAKNIEKSQARIESAKANIEYYANLLNAEKEYTLKTTEDLNELIQKKDELLEKSLLESGYTELLQSLKQINRLAGFTTVKGPGVVVILDDRLVEDPRYPAATSAIHDTDIRQVVDVMRAGGAVAISVNEQRVVATSELTCNGPTVQINKRKYPVPYVIQCVGDPKVISYLLNNDEYLQGRILSNIKFELKISEEIIVPGFSGQDDINQYIDALKGEGVQ